MIMNSRQTDNIRESIVIPLFEIIVYPKTRTKFLIDKTTCEMLLSEMKNIEPVYAIGLTVKSGLKFSDLSGASFYKIGNLLKITFVQPTNDGYLIAAEAVQRVEAISLHQENGQFYSEREK
jgi:ATP-dependent Lon protease